MNSARAIAFLLAALLAQAARYDLNSPGKTVRLADPQIAPQGKHIALVVSRANFEENRYEAELILVDIAAHSNRILSSRRGLTQPRWSPSGDRLCFISIVDTKPQVFILPFNGGEAVQLTRTASGVQHYTWSPD